MARVGALLLTAVLSSIPRFLLRAAMNPRMRSPRVKLAPSDPALTDFTNELSKAIDRQSTALAEPGLDGMVVVDVLQLTRLEKNETTPASEAVSVAVSSRSSYRPLILHYPAGERRAAVQTLIRRLTSQPPVAH
jgi:hypothetical protein